MENIEYLEEQRNSARKEVIKVTIILSVVTILELLIGFYMMRLEAGGFLHNFCKGTIIILMLLKAYYIVAHFMHLGHENKIMKRLILIPLSLFIWFIIAFLADGHSYLELRAKYDPYSVEMNEKKLPATEHSDPHTTNEE